MSPKASPSDVIVQPAPPYYAVGDKVNVIHSPGGARVALAMDY